MHPARAATSRRSRTRAHRARGRVRRSSRCRRAAEALTGRGTEGAEEQTRRLETAKVELAAQEEFDATVVNTDVPEAAREVVDLLTA